MAGRYLKPGFLLGRVINPLVTDTHWARNLRAAGSAGLRSRKGTEPFAIEVPDAEKPPLIEAYLTRWGSQVRSQFEALPDPSEHPVFRLEAPA